MMVRGASSSFVCHSNGSDDADSLSSGSLSVCRSALSRDSATAAVGDFELDPTVYH
jgi:hypothetical protein